MALLSARNLTKSYAGVTVLRDVHFDLEPGEVHALVGENGAGKSTLCRILCGITPPDSGQMEIDSRAYAPRSRPQAEHAGVRMVMQELNLLPTLTVAENIFLTSLPRRLGVINYPRLNAKAAVAIDSIGLRDVDPSVPVSRLGIGQAQLVEIASALVKNCRVLVLDEPTAALTTREIDLLFSHIRRLKNQGVGIIYVSHRMEEIRALSDRITVLRDGRHIATRATSEITHDETVHLMVGRDLSSETLGRSQFATAGAPRRTAMRVVNLRRRPGVRDVSFELHEGEILGFAGLMGSGRTETMRALFAADRAASGQVFLGDSASPARIRSPRDAVRQGIAFLTEDRKAQGLLLSSSIRSNTTLARMRAVSRLGFWISRARESQVAGRYISALSTRCLSADQLVRELSGGNQQKVVLAKWLFRDCNVLIFDEPTRGIDVGAKFDIYRLLRELADQGKAIIVVSSDLLELTAIADRIAVMSAGRLVKTFESGEWTQESIMEAALSGYSASRS
jgi:ribose transport system ATP-binding protein